MVKPTDWAKLLNANVGQVNRLGARREGEGQKFRLHAQCLENLPGGDRFLNESRTTTRVMSKDNLQMPNCCPKTLQMPNC